jgi:acyl CoA:acetate/3-ketoacid CoA transferase alpha subunit
MTKWQFLYTTFIKIYLLYYKGKKNLTGFQNLSGLSSLANQAIFGKNRISKLVYINDRHQGQKNLTGFQNLSGLSSLANQAIFSKNRISKLV